METGDGREILEGLTERQTEKVLEWITEFKLSLPELVAWRRDRECFVKSVKYKLPVQSPVDYICRDIYELKLFGVKVAEFFHKNGEPAVLKICGRMFTREEAMRCVLIKTYLKIPFLFNKGEPQRILNNLASDSRSTRKRTYAPSESSGDERPSSLTIVSVVGAAGTRSQNHTEKRRRPLEPEDQKPSQEDLDRAAAEFASPAVPRVLKAPESEASPRISGVANLCIPTTKSNNVPIAYGTPAAPIGSDQREVSTVEPGTRSSKAPRILPSDGVAVISPAVSVLPPLEYRRTGTASLARTAAREESITPRDFANIESISYSMAPQLSSPKTPDDAAVAERLLIDATSVVLTPKPESLTAIVQQPLNYIVPMSCENVGFPGESIYSVPADTPLQTVYSTPAPNAVQDESSKAYQAMVEIYLKQFHVNVTEFSDWLLAKYGSNVVSQGELFAKADAFLTAIANALQELEKQPSANASVFSASAKLPKVFTESLEKWRQPNIRPLFHKDKTALKYEMFQRVLPVVDDSKKTYLPQAEEIIRYRPGSDFIDSSHFRKKSTKYCGDLIKNVLDFYVLEPDILDELPIECNRRYRENLKSKSPMEPAVMLLHDLGVLISYRNEICMFSSLFSLRDTLFCFEKPFGWIPPVEHMYHVSMEDAIRAVNLARRLKSKLGDETRAADSKKIRKLLAIYGPNA